MRKWRVLPPGTVYVGGWGMSNDLPLGNQTPHSSWGDYNTLMFIIKQAMLKMETCLPVQVVKCSNLGEVVPVGTVDVIPMIDQVNGEGESFPHQTIYNLPYVRIQGGTNGIIIDPEPGDIGIAVFASRDISTIKRTKAPGLPGSARDHDFSDGMYLGGCLNAIPVQYLQFNTLEGIHIHSPVKLLLTAPIIELTAEAAISLNAPNIAITAGETLTTISPITAINAATSINITAPVVNITGILNVTGEITGNNTPLHTHIHSGVQTGGGNTGPPTS